ncbi:MAG TPA: hypothetical protein ENI95_14520 [Chloroflexi bacterium]|nr:hypothetical protein [Chloroflexota bacterium]
MSKLHHRAFGLLVIVPALFVLAACGPPATPITTEPAPTGTPEPTPTSTPTPTPTPIPYDLTVSITDADGNPIAGAEVTLAELGDDESAIQTADNVGQVSWANLPGESVSFSVTAQGYFPLEEAAAIERGPNDLTLTLERDPFGLLPSQACRPEETPLYIEDFQDGEAAGMPDITFNPAWSIEPQADSSGNMIVAARMPESGGGDPGAFSNLNGYVFENAVWRTRFMLDGRGEVSFNWRFAPEPYDVDGQEVFDSRYQIIMGTNFNTHMRRLQQPVLNIGVANGATHPQVGTWHYLEVATYEDTTQVWLDGQPVMSYTDPDIVPPGMLGLEYWYPDEVTTAYFDNISVCQLDAPFVSFPPPEEVAFVDDFNGWMDAGWEWQNENPERWSFTEDGWLEIVADNPMGDERVNTLVRPVPEGDFTVTAHLTAAPNHNFQQAALSLLQNRENYVAVLTGFCRLCLPQTGGYGFFMEAFSGGSPMQGGMFYPREETATDVYLRLVYSAADNSVTGYYATGPTDWQEATVLRNVPPFTHIALGMSNLPAPEEAPGDDLVTRVDYVIITQP